MKFTTYFLMAGVATSLIHATPSPVGCNTPSTIKSITTPEHYFELLIAQEEIQRRIVECAAQLDTDYKDKEIVLVMVMKGAVCIASDLMKAITIPCSLEYVRASSYGNNGMTAGALTLTGLDAVALQGKHVVLVDDIFDTGATLGAIKAQLAQQNPASIKTLVLLLKDKPRVTAEIPDYVLFNIEDKFVIGYGLDYKELYRGLPDIYAKQ